MQGLARSMTKGSKALVNRLYGEKKNLVHATIVEKIVN